MVCFKRPSSLKISYCFRSGEANAEKRFSIQFNAFVKTQKKSMNFMKTRTYVDVVFACSLTETIVQLMLRSKKEYTKPSRQSHIVNGAMVTSYGRCELDKGFRILLQEKNAQILYCDTDSIIYALPRNTKDALPCDER